MWKHFPCHKRESQDNVLDILILEGNINYTNSDRDRMICLDTLAAYYVQEAKKEKNKEKKKELFTKVFKYIWYT